MKINLKNVDQYFEIFVTLIDIGNTNQNLKKGIKSQMFFRCQFYLITT